MYAWLLLGFGRNRRRRYGSSRSTAPAVKIVASAGGDQREVLRCSNYRSSHKPIGFPDGGRKSRIAVPLASATWHPSVPETASQR